MAVGWDTKPGSSGEILVIEDNTVDGMFIQKTLQDYYTNLSVHIVDSCEKGLDYLLRKAGTGQRNGSIHSLLIILDLKFHGMSGFEFLKIIRTDQRFKEIPIIVFSDSKTEHDRVMALGLGANGYFTKSINLNTFLQTIREIGAAWISQPVIST